MALATISSRSLNPLHPGGRWRNLTHPEKTKGPIGESPERRCDARGWVAGDTHSVLRNDTDFVTAFNRSTVEQLAGEGGDSVSTGEGAIHILDLDHEVNDAVWDPVGPTHVL